MMIALILLICSGACLIIVQIWNPFLGWGTFIKILLTLIILIIVIGLLMVFRSDLSEHKKLKDENYLD